MSINVYLKDEVENLKGFRKEERRYDDGSRRDDYHLPGLQIIRDKGRWYFYLNELTDPVPNVVKDLVTEISFYDRIPRYPERIAGIYKYKDAEAELDRKGEITSYGLRIRGKSIENILELYRKIRAGKITPVESWDAKALQASEAPTKEAITS